jgi:hypothetical protein
MRTAVADLRYAIRVLSRNALLCPSRSSPSLHSGSEANTAIFSIVNAVAAAVPLPFHEPDELVRLFHEPPQNAFPGIHRFSVLTRQLLRLEARMRQTFDSMAIYRFRQFTLTGAGEPEAILGGAVGADFFDVVRAQPLLGRVLSRRRGRARAFACGRSQ